MNQAPCIPPPWQWGWPTFVSPPWSNRPGWGSSWCGPPWAPAPWQSTEWLGTMDPWLGWTEVGGWRWPLDGVWNLQQLARCQGLCPQGNIPGSPCFRGTCTRRGCPWLCRGCQAGWPFDAAGRHIGPAKFPNSNRWDCNRVRWLGLAAQDADKQDLYPRWVG